MPKQVRGQLARPMDSPSELDLVAFLLGGKHRVIRVTGMICNYKLINKVQR